MTTALSLEALQEKQDWTVDDLASLPTDLFYELIDGKLVLPSPTGIHQYVGVEVMLALRTHCPAYLLPVVDLSLKVNHRNEPRPDVVVINRKLANVTPAPVEGAILVVEVVSGDSSRRDYRIKPVVYGRAGVPSYWIIDPFPDTGVALIELELELDESDQYVEVTHTTGVFTTKVPYPVTIDLPALTAWRRDILS